MRLKIIIIGLCILLLTMSAVSAQRAPLLDVKPIPSAKNAGVGLNFNEKTDLVVDDITLDQDNNTVISSRVIQVDKKTAYVRGVLQSDLLQDPARLKRLDLTTAASNMDSSTKLIGNRVYRLVDVNEDVRTETSRSVTYYDYSAGPGGSVIQTPRVVTHKNPTSSVQKVTYVVAYAADNDAPDGIGQEINRWKQSAFNTAGYDKNTEIYRGSIKNILNI